MLQFFKADPKHFDVVFVSNATAAVKLVTQSFTDLSLAQAEMGGKSDGFDYWYHRDSHTSLVGARELSQGHHHCLHNDDEVERWLDDSAPKSNGFVVGHGARLGLLAYPGQSNMTGRRLPLRWYLCP